MFHCSSRGGNGYLSACTTNTCNQLTARCGEPHEVCGIHDQKVSKAFTWIWSLALDICKEKLQKMLTSVALFPGNLLIFRVYAEDLAQKIHLTPEAHSDKSCNLNAESAWFNCSEKVRVREQANTEAEAASQTGLQARKMLAATVFAIFTRMCTYRANHKYYHPQKTIFLNCLPLLANCNEWSCLSS